MKLIDVKNNCPVPRGGGFREVRTYQLEDGTTKTKTVRISCFVGKFSNWAEYCDSLPFDDEK